MTISIVASIIFVFLFFMCMSINTLQNRKWTTSGTAFTRIIFLYLVVASVFSPLGDDKKRYIEAFEYAPYLEYIKDYGWTYLTKQLYIICFGSKVLYLFIIAFVYVLGYYLVGKCKFGKQNVAYFLLLSANCLGFWSGSTNILRAGFATAIFLISLCCEHKKILYILLSLFAVFVHNSILILVVGYIITKFYRNFKVYALVWLVFLFLSSANALNFITSFLSTHMGEVGDRIAEYAYTEDPDSADLYQKAGFRLDFILYSAYAIIYSGWLLFKRGYQDEFFKRVSCTYIIANSFWLTMVRVNYADRFALLSWILIPLIILYPYMYLGNSLHFEKKVVFVAFVPAVMNLILAVKMLF